MQIDIVNIQGKKVGELALADDVFGTKVKEHLLWEVVKAQRAAKRAGTHSTKTRANVRGGGKKPYKQKGTGNARQGSTRAPNHVGGGKVFGPHPRDYSYTVPKKVRRAALASALSLRAKEKKLVIVDKLAFEAPKTKQLASILKVLGVESAVLVDSKGNINLSKSARNLAASKYLAPEGLNVYDILNHPGLIIAASAIKEIEQRFQPAAAETASASASA
ncbi:MAG: large subunit ribosomal protein [Myxococcales bacterium]|jgi:large subunit ribosomal protein L4|nr:large subunit ribosomal protein [Myxococcales bacterium]